VDGDEDQGAEVPGVMRAGATQGATWMNDLEILRTYADSRQDYARDHGLI
jgi:hypothetical protein